MGMVLSQSCEIHRDHHRSDHDDRPHHHHPFSVMNQHCTPVGLALSPSAMASSSSELPLAPADGPVLLSAEEHDTGDYTSFSWTTPNCRMTQKGSGERWGFFATAPVGDVRVLHRRGLKRKPEQPRSQKPIATGTGLEPPQASTTSAFEETVLESRPLAARKSTKSKHKQTATTTGQPPAASAPAETPAQADRKLKNLLHSRWRAKCLRLAVMDSSIPWVRAQYDDLDDESGRMVYTIKALMKETPEFREPKEFWKAARSCWKMSSNIVLEDCRLWPLPPGASKLRGPAES